MTNTTQRLHEIANELKQQDVLTSHSMAVEYEVMWDSRGVLVTCGSCFKEITRFMSVDGVLPTWKGSDAHAEIKKHVNTFHCRNVPW